VTFLVWEIQDDADTSLAKINVMYGCPYEDENGYKMDAWDVVIESTNNDAWGFFKPEERLGMVMDDLMPELVGIYDAIEGRPEDFFPDDLFPE